MRMTHSKLFPLTLSLLLASLSLLHATAASITDKGSSSSPSSRFPMTAKRRIVLGSSNSSSPNPSPRPLPASPRSSPRPHRPPSPPSPPPPTVCPLPSDASTILSQPSFSGSYSYLADRVGVFVLYSPVASDCLGGGMFIPFRTAPLSDKPSHKATSRTFLWGPNAKGAGYSNQSDRLDTSYEHHANENLGLYVGDKIRLIWNNTKAQHGVAISQIMIPAKSPPPFKSPSPPYLDPLLAICPSSKDPAVRILTSPSSSGSGTFAPVDTGVYIIFNQFNQSCLLQRMHINLQVVQPPNKTYRPRNLTVVWAEHPLDKTCSSTKLSSCLNYFSNAKLYIGDQVKFTWSGIMAGLAIKKII